jgi:hypothetical protein
MNTHKTFSLLAAAIVVAGQATLFAVDTHATTQGQSRDSYESSYEAQSGKTDTAYATKQNASTIRGA